MSSHTSVNSNYEPFALLRCGRSLTGCNVGGVRARDQESPREITGAQRRGKGWAEGAEERNPDPSRCHVATPEEHARTRCVISDCLPGFVDGVGYISSGGGDRTKREKKGGKGWVGGDGRGRGRAEQKGCRPSATLEPVRTTCA